MKVQLTAMTQPLIKKEECDIYGTTGVYLSIEEYIIYCARVSSEDRLNNETAPKLLRYLIDNRHWSPFEMVSIGFEIVTSRAIAQQLLRHRSFSFQEFSQRYAEVENFEYIELRKQANRNRQSSTNIIHDKELHRLVSEHVNTSFKLYKQMLLIGVAKECARMVLPLCTQTTIVMHGTLRSWIHFLDKRCDVHAQKEIQEIAFAIRKELIKICPWTATALGWSDTF